MTSARKQAALLVHGVGKYISRTARNLGEGEVQSGLLKLLVVDLFEIDDRRTALQLFEELAAPLFETSGNDDLVKCRSLLQRIDGLEDAIRKGDNGAIRQASAMAIEVDELLRKLAREINEGSD